MIRNVVQTVQDREIIKQAPDAVCYINGMDYLVNPYVGDGTGVTVPFNEFLSGVSAGYDVDTFVPTASIQLAVPIELDYLFRSPGGNNLLRTMSEIRVFMKGYKFSERGNTVYYQTFRGFISSISYKPDAKMTQISLQCKGIMGLLEKMQLDLNPSLLSSPALEVTPMTSNMSNFNPYEMLRHLLTYQWAIDGFEYYSLTQQAMDPKSDPYYRAIQDDVRKWNALLYDISRDVHIFGLPPLSKDTPKQTKKSVEYGKQDKDHLAETTAVKGKQKASEDPFNNAEQYALIREFQPDMNFGSIQLINGRVVNRLERLSFICNMLGFEGYQDVDGSVVIKPPLYNLDVTDVNSKPLPANTPGAEVIQQYTYWNPFIIYQPEILDENESEDEGAIRATRMTVRGSWLPAFPGVGSEALTTVVSDVDIPRLGQFGLRTEAPHSTPWIVDSDHKTLYGFCASELARANKGYRTYTVTIPLRPELKLGFPCYFPHRDFYGYTKSISINYSNGGAATMTVTFDSIRRKPMFPETQTVYPASPGEKPRDVTLLTPQPNLVMKWSKSGVTSDATNPAKLNGKFATVPVPLQQVFQQQLEMLDYRTNKINNSFDVNADTPNESWAIHKDDQGLFTTARTLVGTDKAEKDLQPGEDYFHDLRSTRPYTDGKGYELIGPFPWGRWKCLIETVYRFTVGNTVTGETPTSAEQTLAAADAFLFTGEATPSGATSYTGANGSFQADPAKTVLSAMATQSTLVHNTKVFELTYSSTGMPSSASGMQGLMDADAGTTSDVAAISANEYDRAQAFLTSQPKQNDAVSTILKNNPVAAPVDVPTLPQVTSLIPSESGS